MSLDTKYRPRTYQDVLGQRGSVKTLKGLVSEGVGWNQSYLFAGPYGSGKTTLGRILARALLCEQPKEGEPCDECYSCKSMLGGSSDAFIEVDAATNSGKADVKKILEELDYSSFSGRRKLYLFDEAHQLSKDALDALLKPMEENRKGSSEKRLVCIFATTEPEKMRATVLSRCAPAFIIHHVESEEIADRLSWVCDKENFTYDREALVLIADFTEGHIRDALKAIEGVASSNSKYVSLEAVRSYLHVDRNDLLCQILLSTGSEALKICEDVLGNTPPSVAFERLLSATMFSISMGLGAGNPPPYWNKEVLKKAWDKHGDYLLTLADMISSKPRRATEAMFKCEVLKWTQGGHVVYAPPVPQARVVAPETPPQNQEIKKAPEPHKEDIKKIPQVSLMEFAKWVKDLKEKNKSTSPKGAPLGKESNLGGDGDIAKGGGSV